MKFSSDFPKAVISSLMLISRIVDLDQSIGLNGAGGTDVCLFFSSFLPARRYASAGYSDRNVSVCPSVRHAPVLCQNEES